MNGLTNKQQLNWAVLLSISFAAFAPLTRGQLAITVGDFQLSPNAPEQIISLFVQNTSTTVDISVAGLTVNLKLADGEPSTPAPQITGVDILTGTVFKPDSNPGNNTGQSNPTSEAHAWTATTTTASGTVTLGANTTTRLATVTLDTTGFTAGHWAFNLGDTGNGPTVYFDLDAANDIAPSITDGFISVVPEPSTSFCVSALLLALAGVRQCKRARI